MIVKKSRANTIKEIKKGNIKGIMNWIPNLTDTILQKLDEKYDILNMINKDFVDKRKKKSSIDKKLFVMAGISSKMKRLCAVSDMGIGITSPHILNKLKVNIYNENKEPVLKESNIREFLGKYTDVDIMDFFKNHTKRLINALPVVNTPVTHILDCSELEVNFDNENYEKAEVVTNKKGEKARGYKIGMLRRCTETSGIVEEIIVDTIKISDIKLTRDTLLKSKYLKSGDTLLQDRGFIDLVTFKRLDKEGINIIMPVKKNMEIYRVSVAESIKKGKWITHPNKKRRGQDIQMVTNMQEWYIEEGEKTKKAEKQKELEYKISCCVIRFDISKNKDVLDEKETVKNGDKYAYAVIITNDTSLNACEIIRKYEQRPEIEEDFRQLKDFWGLTEFKSTKFNMILFHIVFMIIGYNYYQIFKSIEGNENYLNTSLPVVLKKERNMVDIKESLVIIIVDSYFEMFDFGKLFDIYDECDMQAKQKLKSVFRYGF